MIVHTARSICLRCVDKNEVLVDENEKFLRQVSSTVIDCPEHLNTELLKNADSCQSILKLFIQQRVMLSDHHVRFSPGNDMIGIQGQTEQIQLSANMKRYLMEVSKTAYAILQEEGFLGELTEFDARRQAVMDVFGKEMRVSGHFDMLSLVGPEHSKSPPTAVTPIPKLKEVKKLPECDGTVNPEDTDSIKNIFVQKSVGKRSEKSSMHIHGASSEIDRNKEMTPPKSKTVLENQETAAVTFLLTPRNYVSAVEILGQLIGLHLHTIAHIYFVVCHTGPLVEQQTLAVYHYAPADDTIAVCRQPKLSIETLENSWRTATGKGLQVLADLKNYFRYLAFDCPGVKNSEEELREKHSRHESRKLARREMRKQRKLLEKQDQLEKLDSLLCQTSNTR